MAFNRQSWSTVSSSCNTGVKTLQDGSFIGAPINKTYAHAVDTAATISAAGYFNEVAPELKVYDRIYAVGSDVIVDLRVSNITSNPTVVSTTTTLGLGDVNGPAVATDNAVVRFDGVTGKVIQNSAAILSDADALSGLTSLTTDNVNINGNTVSSIDVNGDLNFTPNGVGLNVLANAQVTNVTASRAVVTDAASNLNESATTSTEIGYISGLTSAVQTQINNLIAATYQITVTQVGHGLTAGDVVYIDAAGDYIQAEITVPAAADSDVAGIIVLVNGNDITVQFGGHITAGVALTTIGAIQYLGAAGTLVEAKPGAGALIKPILLATSNTSGYWLNNVGIIG